MKSFTLIEILIVIAITVILIGLAIPSYRFFQKESDLISDAEEIINILRLAQNKTLASEGASQYGVYFDQSTLPHQYVLFKYGDEYSDPFRDISLDIVYKLSDPVEISAINLNGGTITEIVFDRVLGTTSQSGDLTIQLKDDNLKTRTVYIANSGEVDLISPSIPSDAARVKDVRHVHFDLGWSIRNATSLKFEFIGSPPIEEVNMAGFFNSDVPPTEFEWQGTFSIGGNDQVFRVHTHSLDDLDTLLCIHRDRNEGKTDHEVKIYIVDSLGVNREIVHYLANVADTVNKGVDVWLTLEIQ